MTVRHNSQGPSGACERHALLGGGVVAPAEHARVEHGVRVDGEDRVGEFVDAPLLLRTLPLTVEPQQVGTVAGRQLPDLRVAVGQEAVPRDRVLRARRRAAEAVVVDPLVPGVGVRVADGGVVGVRPVGVRVVQPDLQAVRAQRVGVAADQVAAGRGVAGHRQAVLRGVPQGHAVVVARGEHRVAGARAGEQPGPGVAGRSRRR